MKKQNVAVLVSGGGTNLGAIIKFRDEGKLESGELKVVISSKEGAYALERAKAAGIDGRTVPRKACSSQEDFEGKILEILKEYEIDVIVLAGFMCILSPGFIECYRDRIINVHPSLIPSFCGEGFFGLRVHQAALDYGVKVTGATVHFVNEIPDGGKIIFQKAVEIKDGDTPEILQKRVMEEAEWKILPLALEKVAKSLCENNG